eukprot:TRINITY_DN15417_c0_g1_i1.p1 TRINITY_DN15417_c0_g1~~TRINITY_DN15417_c0_g1_i1.p1  ORF type:complete len:146 (+),score=0.09 TRINITY_DN15417_c0_g1_i1:50-439(+)
MVGGYLAVAVLSCYFQSKVAFTYWLLPSLLGQPFLRFYLLAEHTGCTTGPNMLSNTRTTNTTWFYRKLAWNMPFHAEHHSFPAVPFYQLDKLHHKLIERNRWKGMVFRMERHVPSKLAVEPSCVGGSCV